MKSEIRVSEVNALLDRVRKKAYRKYLSRMKLVRLRGFRNAEINFEFPVTALVGPNGAGKTTILGAAALIYEKVKPRRFFAKSGKYDDSMQNWRVEYELIDRDQQGASSISRTASYLRAKWNRDAVQRRVVIFGVARTLPASERKELARCISGDFKGVTEEVFEAGVVDAVEKILGKEAANYLRVDADKAGKVSIYAARGTSADDTYSEFHFGAGEASVIRIVAQIENADEESLILIEEIENGLHPVATRRLVEYLIDVARRKSCQVIFTTHSNDALAPLPTNAVWAAYSGKSTQLSETYRPSLEGNTMSALLTAALTAGGAFIGVVLTVVFQTGNARSQRRQEMILKTYETRIDVYHSALNILISIRDIQSTTRSDLKSITELNQRLNELIERQQWAFAIAKKYAEQEASPFESPEEVESMETKLEKLEKAKTFLEGYALAFGEINKAITERTTSEDKRQEKIAELGHRANEYASLMDLVGSEKARTAFSTATSKVHKGEQILTEDVDRFIAIARADIGISI